MPDTAPTRIVVEAATFIRTLTLTDIKVNCKPPEGSFQFNAPAGVHVERS
ncbi:MAG: hypothetical protein JRH20_06835 [Deltaproteobacteria bacterium]|nr:hypothetical protein [Deltaproteobacteria bacterium]